MTGSLFSANPASGSSDSTPFCQASLSANLDLSALRPNCNQFEVWHQHMGVVDLLARQHEAAFGAIEQAFSSLRVIIELPGGLDLHTRKSNLYFSLVPRLDSDECSDPVAELFKGSPIAINTPCARFDAERFRAVFVVPDYRDMTCVTGLETSSIQFNKEGSFSDNDLIPEHTFLLGVLDFDTNTHQFMFRSGAEFKFMVENGIPESQFLKTASSDWAAICRGLNASFAESSQESERNFCAELENSGGLIRLHRNCDSIPMPSPYVILARCLDAIAMMPRSHNQSDSGGRIGLLEALFGQQQPRIAASVDRPKIEEVRPAIEEFRNLYQLETLKSELTSREAERPLKNYLSIQESLWLYRVVGLMTREIDTPHYDFADFERHLDQIDETVPVNPDERCKPFREFHALIQQIRNGEEYVESSNRRNDCTIALYRLEKGLNSLAEM